VGYLFPSILGPGSQQVLHKDDDELRVNPKPEVSNPYFVSKSIPVLTRKAAVPVERAIGAHREQGREPDETEKSRSERASQRSYSYM
jgi:hypothetical protein